MFLETSEPLVSEEDEALRRQVETFAMKFQQYTGPVMAKGVEDTAFYRYYPLASLNEVGGDLDARDARHLVELDELRVDPSLLLDAGGCVGALIEVEPSAVAVGLAPVDVLQIALAIGVIGRDSQCDRVADGQIQHQPRDQFVEPLDRLGALQEIELCFRHGHW